MSTVGKIPQRRVHTGDFAGEQQQRLAQQGGGIGAAVFGQGQLVGRRG